MSPRRLMAGLGGVLLVCFITASSALGESVLSNAYDQLAVSQRATDLAEPATIDPKLPNVLLIGNSNSLGYTPMVRALMKNKANVFHIPDYARTAKYSLEHLDQWLGKRQWKTIVFECGSWDTVFSTKRQFEKSFRELVQRLKKTKAQLLYVTMTPAPEALAGYEGSRLHYQEVVTQYHVIASKVLKEFDVRILDLFSISSDLLEQYQQPGDYRFTNSGYRRMGQAVYLAMENPHWTSMPGQASLSEYYMAVFSTQGGPSNPPRKAHTFATFVKINQQGQILKEVTISWGPASGVVKPFNTRPEKGKNHTLLATLRKARRKGARISMWGPYQIQPELFRRAQKRKRDLDSGRIKYVVFDLPWRYEGTACMCMHAVSDVSGHLKTGSKRGDAASAAVAQHLAPFVINANVPGDRSIYNALGLSRFPIFQRKVPLTNPRGNP